MPVIALRAKWLTQRLERVLYHIYGAVGPGQPVYKKNRPAGVHPNLGRLVNYGIKNVVWETPACGKSLERSVLKPIGGEELEPLLEFLGMSLYNISLLLSSNSLYLCCRQRTCACSTARRHLTFQMFPLITYCSASTYSSPSFLRLCRGAKA